MQPWPDSILRTLAEASPVESAQALLGSLLVSPDGRLARIVETEAYGGSDDRGSHAWHGVRPKNAAMFGPPGLAYVYISYGCHWMLNVVCCPEGLGSAVLIRAAEPLEGLEAMRLRRPKIETDSLLLKGPGRLAQAYGINGSHDGTALFDSSSLFHLLPPVEEPGEILISRRIGLAAGRGDDLPWRFILKNRLKWASRGILPPI